MKINLILALLISTISYSQISLNEMKTILKMDYDSFETFVMNKGFVFNDRQNDNFDYVSYVKGYGKNTRYISLYTRSLANYKKKVNYQTAIESEYLSLKKQMKEQGFYFFETFDNNENNDEKVFAKIYRNKIYELRVHSIKSEDNIVTYEIGFEYLKK